MKSALELAMEKADKMEGKKRTGLTAEQKENIAEIRRKTEAKIAEAEIMMNEKVSQILGEPEACEIMREEFYREKAKFEEKAEEEIAKIREGG